MPCYPFIINTPAFPSAGGGGGGGGAPTGPAGGDLTGTYPNPTVDGLQGVVVSATAPTSGQYLRYNGTVWIPAGISSGDLPASVMESGDAAGGDLSGTYPNPAVDGLQGRPVANTAPTTDQALVWDGSQWTPSRADAKELQGRTVATTLPANDEALIWNNGVSQWEPGKADAKKLQGRTLVNTAPANDEAVVWNSGTVQWEPGKTDAKKLQGRTLVNTAPSNGQAVVWNSGTVQWEPATITGVPPGGAAGGNLTGTYPNPTIANNAVGNAALRDSLGNSVIGRQGAAAGDPHDIIPGAEGQVLRYAGSFLAFGMVTTDGLAGNVVTNEKIRDAIGNSVIGRSSSGFGDPADIVASTDGEVLRLSGTTLGFGTVVSAGIADGAITSAKLATEAFLKKYTVTTADADNTASEIDSIKATIPANDWADGTAVVFDAILNGKNNTGTDHDVTFRIYYGSTSVTIATRTIATAGSEAPYRIQVELWRTGTTILVRWQRDSSGTDASPSSMLLPGSVGGGFATINEYTTPNGEVWTGQSFSLAKDIKITTQWDAAASELFIKVITAKIYRW